MSSVVYAPPEPPKLMVYAVTPKVSMKCSLPIMAGSQARNGLQLFVGCFSVLMNSAQPSPRRVVFIPVSGFTPSPAPWTYQPPGQPAPWIAIRPLFQPFGGEKGLGAGSLVGSCST